MTKVKKINFSTKGSRYFDEESKWAKRLSGVVAQLPAGTKLSDHLSKPKTISAEDWGIYAKHVDEKLEVYCEVGHDRFIRQAAIVATLMDELKLSTPYEVLSFVQDVHASFKSGEPRLEDAIRMQSAAAAANTRFCA